MTSLECTICYAALAFCVSAVLPWIILTIVLKVRQKPKKERLTEPNASLKPGCRIGIIVSTESRIEAGIDLVKQIINSKRAEIERIKKASNEVYYTLSNGGSIEIEVFCGSNSIPRGKRFNYLYIDKDIPESSVCEDILPYLRPLGTEKFMSSWEFFDTKKTTRRKKYGNS